GVPRRHRAEGPLGEHGHRFRCLDSEAVLADIDAYRGQRARVELEVDYSLHFVAPRLAAVCPPQLLGGLECFSSLRWVERIIKNAIGCGLEGVARPWPGLAGDGQ